MSARRLHEALQPTIVGWFLLEHKHSAAWILMHPRRRAVGGPVAVRTIVEKRTRGAPTSRCYSAIQDDIGGCLRLSDYSRDWTRIDNAGHAVQHSIGARDDAHHPCWRAGWNTSLRQ